MKIIIGFAMLSFLYSANLFAAPFVLSKGNEGKIVLINLDNSKPRLVFTNYEFKGFLESTKSVGAFVGEAGNLIVVNLETGEFHPTDIEVDKGVLQKNNQNRNFLLTDSHIVFVDKTRQIMFMDFATMTAQRTGLSAVLIPLNFSATIANSKSMAAENYLVHVDGLGSQYLINMTTGESSHQFSGQITNSGDVAVFTDKQKKLHTMNLLTGDLKVFPSVEVNGLSLNTNGVYAVYVSMEAKTKYSLIRIHLETGKQTVSHVKIPAGQSDLRMQDGFLTFKRGGEIEAYDLSLDRVTNKQHPIFRKLICRTVL